MRAASEIAEAIEARPDVRTGPDVAGGAAGVALLNAYLAVTSNEKIAAERAVRWLGRAIDRLRPGAGMSLFGGGAGVAWVGEHVSKLLGRAPVDPSGEVERALLGLLSRTPWRSHFDLISGLAGYGVYALERLPRAGARECLEQVVVRLDELAERTKDGTTWRTRVELLSPEQRDGSPDGYYNLGVAHGVPGILALLALCATTDVASARARSLVDGGVEWLLAQRLASESEAAFGYWLTGSAEPTPARAAWCYGDPGVAAALLVAARALRRSDWEVEAISLARRAGARPPSNCGVADPWLCHGSAGLGHLFNRMHQATADPALAAAARYWLQRTLAMRRPQGAGFAGFHLLDDELRRGTDGSGFLTGAAGVGLALLAAATDVEPGWDRLLVVSGAT
jgi:lantibiotic biosynthesis protein